MVMGRSRSPARVGPHRRRFLARGRGVLVVVAYGVYSGSGSVDATLTRILHFCLATAHLWHRLLLGNERQM